MNDRIALNIEIRAIENKINDLKNELAMSPFDAFGNANRHKQIDNYNKDLIILKLRRFKLPFFK